MTSKGRTESSEVKHDCRQKLTNLAKRKATPGSQVDFLLPVGARSQTESCSLCSRELRSRVLFFFIYLAGTGGERPRTLPLDPLLIAFLFSSQAVLK